MNYFVSGDIHGFYDEWQSALKEKGFDISNPEHKIILCGDLFDRGHQPKGIIDFVLKHKDRIILIRGNHEDLMQQMIDRNYNDYGDIQNGTTGTIIDLYPEWQVSEFDLKKIAKKTRLQEVLDMCVDYYETTHYNSFTAGYQLLKIAICMIVIGEQQEKNVWKRLVGQTQ